ncbi:DM13 domain-containing protein [Oxynema sp. CENA135]|uniref:DM13 domain-containing protein n=1 Tax=Oxynema sp. CENA135 TaxID=984206 RepID=UPI00190CA20D|nr:DM13 domain-containing protein [Oxynema sp. CENA135]MBK4729532.1 DM13 domain-containing protein [Oxynema sp. CENA135]
MKLSYLTVLAVVSILSWGSVASVTVASSAVRTQTTTIAQMNSSAIAGTFVSAEHPTEGMARIVMENGKYYLELDENFKTDPGPDLFVILHQSAQLPNSGIEESDYISLGMLRSIEGAQRYEIPADVDLDRFKAAAIWCKEFNATFGYASLSENSTSVNPCAGHNPCAGK